MIAMLCDSALLQDHDAVSVSDGREPVRNRQHGSIPHQAIDGLGHQRLALGIERARGFIQDQDRCGAEEGTGRAPIDALPSHGGLALSHCAACSGESITYGTGVTSSVALIEPQLLTRSGRRMIASITAMSPGSTSAKPVCRS